MTDQGGPDEQEFRIITARGQVKGRLAQKKKRKDWGPKRVREKYTLGGKARR